MGRTLQGKWLGGASLAAFCMMLASYHASQRLRLSAAEFATVPDLQRLKLSDLSTGRNRSSARAWVGKPSHARPTQASPVECRLRLVETEPGGLVKKHYANSGGHVNLMSTIHAWFDLVDKAHFSIELVTQWGIYNNSGYGIKFYERLSHASKRRVSIKIGYNQRLMNDSSVTPADLKKTNPQFIEERMLNIWGLIQADTGIVHSKMILSDRRHFYIGSANLGNRGTTRTKEMGVLATDCPVLGEDAGKIFDLFWTLPTLGRLEGSWNESFSSRINKDSPLRIFNPEDGHQYDVFLSAGPGPLVASGRTEDLDAILWCMDRARKFVFIAVNEYVSMDVYKDNQPWTVIDDAIGRAITTRNVTFRFLLNDLATHRSLMLKTMRRLTAMNTLRRTFVEFRLIKGNLWKFHGSHNKFMVTDNAAFIGTSNWTEDYFSTTAGQGFVFAPVSPEDGSSRSKRSRKGGHQVSSDLREQLEGAFLRDWNSKLSFSPYLAS